MLIFMNLLIEDLRRFFRSLRNGLTCPPRKWTKATTDGGVEIFTPQPDHKHNDRRFG